MGDFAPLEIALEDRYGVGEVLVSATNEEGRSTELAVGGLAVSCLARVCGPETTLGVSWGTTVRALVEAVPRIAFKCDRVVPLVGSIGRAETVLHSNRACLNLAAKLGVESPKPRRPRHSPLRQQPQRVDGDARYRGHVEGGRLV